MNSPNRAPHLRATKLLSPTAGSDLLRPHNQTACRRKGNGSTGHGNRYLARVLGQIAVSAARTDTFVGERHWRIARGRGAKRAIVRSVLTIIWHLPSGLETGFHDSDREAS